MNPNKDIDAVVEQLRKEIIDILGYSNILERKQERDEKWVDEAITQALQANTERARDEERERIYKRLAEMRSVYETMDTGSALKALQQPEPLDGK